MEERENAVVRTFETLVAEIGVDVHALFAGHFVVCRKLSGGGAGFIHQPGGHQHLCFDSRCEVLNIDIPQFGENLFLTLMAGVKVAEIVFDALVCAGAGSCAGYVPAYGPLRGHGAATAPVAAFRRVGGGVSDDCVRGATAFFVPL